MSVATVTAGVGGAGNRPRAAAVAVAGVAAATAAGTALMFASGTTLSWAVTGNVSHSLLLGGAGWWLTRSRTGRRVGALLLAAGAAGALGVLAGGWASAGLAAGWPGGEAAAWLGLCVWALWVVPLFTVLPAIYPDGQAASPSWRWVPWLGVAATALTVLASALEPGPMPIDGTDGPPNPLAVPHAATLMSVAGFTVAAAVLAALSSLGARWRRARPAQRQQMKFLWYVAALVLAVELAGGLLPYHAAQLGYFLIPVLLVGAIALSVRRYRLYDIDLVMRRTMVFAALTTVVFAVYLGTVAALGAAVDPSPGVALLASAAVAGLADPVRRRLQRAVTRWAFGQREEPLEALAELRQQLRAVADAAEIPATTAAAVARALRAPHVSIQVLRDGVPHVVARLGAPAAEPVLDVPLEWRGELIGTLRVGPRAPGEPYARGDLALLDELAHGIGSALHAVRLAEELAVARERAAHATADERRRLRHDLHDGLGPRLSGIGLAIDGVRRGLSAESPVEKELHVIAAEVRTAATEIRRIIDAVQPSALADLGLVAAVADHLERCATLPDAPRITYRCAELDEARLPAAVADAAYLVVLEATANVLRHAGAGTCTVTLAAAHGRLDVRVSDDGSGIGERYVAGVGTGSMRRRVQELGGRFQLGAGAGGGTDVRAEFPLEVSR